MRIIKLLILFVCVVTVSALAETTGTTTPQQPESTGAGVHVALKRNTGKRPLRMPSLNPSGLIVGSYDEAGVFSVDLPEDSMWEMTVETIGGEVSTYPASTPDLRQGVYVGVMSAFSITITNGSGIIYTGEVSL